MKALILCNGEPPSPALLEHHLQGAELVVCTDGAIAWVREQGVQPHVIIGDLDSCGTLRGPEVVDCGSHYEQENTDAEKALFLTLERGATSIVWLGATGQRLDHTLGNVWIVARYHDCADMILADDWAEMRVISGRFVMPSRPGQVISLMALTPDVSLETEGLEWPLRGALSMGTRGLSNEAIGDEVAIDVQSGLVAVIIPAVP